ncbi:SDR family NAD(P)-dependent oxidoreductase [Nitriliruptor alkaliphilus]|uniref:SDR family NAD(P)-dependent oxidoreductase n=1 Tax=Nitriliruptor alkaliphilus TaxID=427918 RepID=UPI000698625D|nr:SDR family NAD(P)-dependent oxidoreductase [Nitriliruptor alkaliphilus]
MTSTSTTSLDGRVAIVTGAGRGLGRAEALALADRGARVVVNDLGPRTSGAEDPAAEVVAEIRSRGGDALVHHGDVADLAVAGGLLEAAVTTYGGLDALVNNAGIVRDRMIFSMSEQEFDAVIRVHLRGHFCTLRHATAYWRDRAKATGGPVDARVINTASEAFLFGSPGQPNYAAAKGGIAALTLSVAGAMAKHGVRANVICPRARTQMTEGVFDPAVDPDDDPLDADHVATLVAYLASPASARLSGQVFVAYGGFVGLMDAPQLRAEFHAPGGRWDVDALAGALDAHLDETDPRRSFAAVSLMRVGAPS